MALPSCLEQGLRAALEKRRHEGQYWGLPLHNEQKNCIDFNTNDSLSLVTSGALRTELLQELSKNLDANIGSGACRLNGGSTDYMVDLEKMLANVHNTEDALSQLGDAIVYDSLVHASVHDGIKQSRASIAKYFTHNDLSDLAKLLDAVKSVSPIIQTGKRTVFIAIESFYSLDGDMAPLDAFIQVAQKSLPQGNYVFTIDEAHSNGVVGLNGAGFVSALGLEKHFTLRLQTCGKALGSVGAIVLCSPLVKEMFINYARNFIYTTAPPLLNLVTVKSAYKILASADGQQRIERLQHNIRYFFETLHQHPDWPTVAESGRIRLRLALNWQKAPFLTPIVPLITKPERCLALKGFLEQQGFATIALQHPIVSRSGERVRVVIHAHNTQAEINSLVDAIMQWGKEEETSISGSRKRAAQPML
ncbi:pyridoxal phosphate-dependent transferase [Penicillium taxi]|uniref:pyridoxal phosphate-dependent transferase n=1 Tax=Penicillium taxi TaxID=168475 RepID=UPI0025459DBE|nr:pyridoxal phosphate-dependent transferase [Penicillium taxi]KAJ5888254.1 pyridoxal phosphate-dependent transferase [Penicillium taxi]